METPEDKIVLKTASIIYSKKDVTEPAITFDTAFCALAELYAEANRIGWETKVLDSYGDWLRAAHAKAR